MKFCIGIKVHVYEFKFAILYISLMYQSPCVHQPSTDSATCIFIKTRGNLLTALKIKKRPHCTVPVTLDVLFFVEHITITYSFFGS